ncbi:MAG: hypothetical protein ASARMPREDX12_006671 [Alectoria sarmentosa]|nr:MAG: hypothetical protein ASARMPREDX12_006671 [Alectoria sarmentosa]
MAYSLRAVNLLKAADNWIPLFLCPSLPSFTNITHDLGRRLSRPCRRQLHVDAAVTLSHGLPTPLQLLDLPRLCPGCGAFTQIVSPEQPGFYGINRKSVRAFIDRNGQSAGKGYGGESELFERVLGAADASLLLQMGLQEGGENNTKGRKSSKETFTPVCNRCHNLTHHRTGYSVVHPTIQSIQEIIAESPHKYNHIYHVLDAADFPLSLIPSLHRSLSAAPQRSLNRRAKTNHYQYGRKAEISFIITRSDLLAPKKEQVDSLMPYILEVLRGALGKSADNARLGNVRCVSSKRGWWTKQVKEDIWNRGGGGWMVGKVNVGKSNLFENVFPKGRNDGYKFGSLRRAAQQKLPSDLTRKERGLTTTNGDEQQSLQAIQDPPEKMGSQLPEDSLLPPAPPETPYPVLPLVSSLPGTTASPIRVPFGGGKGELIDLPGLARGDLEQFVTDVHKIDLVMRDRVKPEQLVIKPSQSLLVGGLLRVTPTTPDLIFLAYPFLPLRCHVTSTERAIAIHSQHEDSGVSTIAKPGIGSRMQSAGNFALKWDVTKQRAGPLTKAAAAGMSTKELPFMVFSADILVEGCGWIELVAQVRKKDMEKGMEPGDLFDSRPYPMIEVSSPDGGHVGVRQPMGIWSLCGEKPVLSSKGSVRPRRSMKGVKKNLKKARRAVLSSYIYEQDTP